jgi:hypothetical protein
MELNISSLSDFVRNANIMFLMGKDSVPQVMRGSGLVKEISVPQLTGNTREFTEIDLNEYAKKKGESDQSARAKVQQGYSKTATLKRIASDIGISYEMRTQGKYYEIKQRLTNLGQLAPNRMDLDLSHRIGFGSATTYADMDGDTVDISVGDTLALYSAVHTLRGSSTTFRNILANNPQLSRGALEAMELLRVQNVYNQFGEKLSATDDILWTTDDPNTVNNAKEILRSTSNPTQNNDGVPNVYQGKYRHVVLPRVATDKNGANDTTKSKYWGLASSRLSTLMLGVHEEAHLKAPPTEGSNAEEFSTDDWNFGVRAGYLIATVNAVWISVSYGDGTA